MNLTPDEKQNLRVAFAAAAMHALLGALRPVGDGTQHGGQTLNFDGNEIAEAAVKQADQLMQALAK